MVHVLVSESKARACNSEMPYRCQ